MKLLNACNVGRQCMEMDGDFYSTHNGNGWMERWWLLFHSHVLALILLSRLLSPPLPIPMTCFCFYSTPSGFAAAPRANICIDPKTRGWILRQPRAFNAFARNPMFSSFSRKWEFSHFLAISCRKVEREHLHSRVHLVWKSKFAKRHLKECCPSFCSSFNFLTRLMVLQQLQSLWSRIR